MPWPVQVVSSAHCDDPPVGGTTSHDTEPTTVRRHWLIEDVITAANVAVSCTPVTSTVTCEHIVLVADVALPTSTAECDKTQEH